jgi:uncharacterized repeat protein (TIGR04042 family)
MPEMTVTVRWPDGAVQHCYSPSLVMHDHLTAGADYSVADFVGRARTGLTQASDRVRATYGFACTSAMATLTDIDRTAARFAATDVVAVITMAPALPVASR